MRYALALMIALSVVGGCARRPAPPPELPVIAEAPPPVEAPVEALQEPVAPAPAPEPPAPTTEGARPRPTPGPPTPAPTDAPPAAEKPRGEKLPWRVPEGPLDDAKFVVISAKFTVAAIRLSEEGQADQDTMMDALRAILKQGRVTVDEYISYAAQLHEDPERARKTGDAIIRLAEERGGVKLTDEAAAALGGLEPRAIVEAE